MTIKTYPMVLRAALAVFVSTLAGVAALRAADPVAFPGAEGFGATATGGRGGSVYIVTNLNDSGPGSFRDAVNSSNRIVVFAVGGVININSAITVQSNITIAGQTAPGDGITIYGNTVAFKNNVICRYIRFHGSINMPSGNYTLQAGGMVKGIFDHVSVTWGRWDSMKLDSASSDITFQHCLIGEAINPQWLGALFEGPTKITVHHTFWANNKSRNPKAKANIEYINNVVYNWGGSGFVGGHSGAHYNQDIINNYFIAGPSSSVNGFVADFGSTDHVYHSGNYTDTDKNGSLNGRLITDADFTRAGAALSSVRNNISPVPVTIDDAATALQKVMAVVGASDRRDPVDTRMITQLATYGTGGAIIGRESEAGGQPPMANGIPPADTNSTGIPDWWAQAMDFGGPATTVWANTARADGYTNLEFYINSIVTSGAPAVVITGITPAAGSAAADPVTGGSVTAAQNLRINGTAPVNATVEVSRVDSGVLGTTTADASGNWTYDYTATTLPERQYVFTARVQQGGAFSLPSAAHAVCVKTTADAAPVISRFVVSASEKTFAGTAAPYSTVNVFIQGGATPIATATADGHGNWTAITTETFLSQSYTFEASSIDLAGITSALSAPFDVDMSIPAPAFTSISADTGVSATDQITNSRNLIFNGTAQPGANVKVYYILNNGVSVTTVGTVTADAAGDWTLNYTSTTLAEGVYTLMATADTGATPSPMSHPFIVTIDLTRPTVASIRRQDPDTVNTSASTLVYRVTFAEPVAGVAQNNFTVTRTGSGMAGGITGFAQIDSTTYDVTVTGAAGDGTLRVDLTANLSNIRDLAGNQCNTSYTGGQTYTMRYIGSGVWVSEEGAAWSEATAWEDSVVADGVGATADFSALDLSEQSVVTLDSAVTLGRLVFGDADEESPGTWRIADGGGSITLANPGSATPEIRVTYENLGPSGTLDYDKAANGRSSPVIIDAPFNSNAGFVKNGWGTIQFNNIGVFSGSITVNQGYIFVGPGALLNMTQLLKMDVNAGSGLFVVGGTFSTTADVSMVFTSQNIIQVSAGRADFKRIVSGNNRNGLIKVTGGIMTADEIMLQRSADGSGGYSNGVVVTGGTATIATLGVGTTNSWGAVSVEGTGKLIVTGPLWNGYQQSPARGGQIRVTGGELVSTDTVNGIVMCRNNGSNANNIAELHINGGTVTAKRITLGYNSSVNAGSATINMNHANSALYLGSPGLVRNGAASGFTATVNLTNGTLGADENWSTTVPLNINGGSMIIKAASADGVPHDITLGGVLSNSGAITKTGGGTLTLSATNTFSGPITIADGLLNLTGRIATSPEPVTISASGLLLSSNAVNRPVVLASGGGLLVTATPLAIAGSLTKSGSGRVPFTLDDPALANLPRIIVATFESTNLTAADFDLFVQDDKILKAVVTGTSLELVPYASVEIGFDTGGITGGGSAAPQVATDAAGIKAALEASGPASILVSGAVDFTALPGGVINVASDKTILGQSDVSTLTGSLVLGEDTSNVIIIGVNITNPAGNGLVLDGAKDVLVNHTTFYDCDGPLVSIINGAENVTLSWNEFCYTSAFGGNRATMLIGRPDGETRPFDVRLRYNHWGEGCDGAMPAINYGQIHMYDNYLCAPGNTAATTLGAQAQLFSANNVYQNVAAPIATEPGALLFALDNTYVSTTGVNDDRQDMLFSPAYSYVLEPAIRIGANVPAYAGNNAGVNSATPEGPAATSAVLNPGGLVPNGATLMLVAAVYGATPVSYQWNLGNFPIPGATEAIYTIDQARAVEHAGTYTVSADLSTGETVVSGASTVAIDDNELPVLLNISFDQNVRLGDAAVFAVTVASNSPVRYQWRKNGVIIPFATNPALNVHNVTRNDAGSYNVIITNDAGSITTHDLMLTIVDANSGSGDGGGGAPSWWLLGAGALLVSLRVVRKWKRHLLPVILLLMLAAVLVPADARAADGTWSAAGNGNWSDAGNWAGGTVADGADSTANLTNAGNKTVTLTAPQTIGNITFDGSNWTIASSGAGNGLTLETISGVPTINVNATTNTISASLAGTQGFTKTGTGVLILTGSSTINGHILVSATAGTLRVGAGGYLDIGSNNIRVTGGTTSIFEIAGGTFRTTGVVVAGAQHAWEPAPGGVSTNMSRMLVSSGYANIGKFTTASDSNGALIVTGGTLVADSVDILRNAAGSGSYAGGFIVQGGIVEANHVGISIGNSNGAMSVEGGTVTVSGSFVVASGTTSGRGGQLRVQGGRLTSTDTVDGLILCRTNGTNANTPGVFLVDGGIATLEKITLGYDATMNAGSATVTISDGALYLGSGGIVKNGAASGFTTTITLSGGTLGAKDDWSTTHPLSLSGDPIILAATESGVAANITFDGVLSGAGGFTKSGAGTLTLAATNTFTGTVTINGGILMVDGSIAAGANEIILSTGGTLCSTTGAINRTVVLDGGCLDLTAAVPLTLAGLTKAAGSGNASITYTGTAPSEGVDVTIINFSGATNLTDADFDPVYIGSEKYAVHVTDGALLLTVWKESVYIPAGLPEGITGGGNEIIQIVTTPAEFKTLAEADGPATIVINGALDLSALGGVINIASDKTIAGQDENAVISGHLKIAAPAGNVIIGGLTITNAAGNGLVIDGARDVYVTQCTFYDCDGALVSAVNGADNITISWSEFYYAAGFAGQRSAMKIGNAGAETRPLRITLHHNYWAEGCDAGMPVANYGYVHMYGNYLRSPGNTAASVSAAQSQMLSSHNVYQDMDAPLAKTDGGLLRVLGENTYVDTTGAPATGDDAVFVPDYSYVLAPAGQVGALVPLYAGNYAGIKSIPPAEPGDVAILATATMAPTGGRITLTGSSSGLHPQSYQWYLDNFPIAGATGSGYVIGNAREEQSGAYSVGVNLATGDTIMSGAARITIGAGLAPVIKVQPASIVVARQSAAIFTVVAEGSSVLRYQWQKNGANMPGETESTLYILDTMDTDKAAYSVTVSNDYGSITSESATLAFRDQGGTGGGGGAPSWLFLCAIAALAVVRRLRKQ